LRKGGTESKEPPKPVGLPAKRTGETVDSYQETEDLKNADTIIMETHARYVGEEGLRVMMTKLDELDFRIVEQIGFVVVL
jgi:hypothetical protein